MRKPILIVASPYYQEIGAMLLRGAQSALANAGYEAETVTVPGALEIPAAIALGHASGKFDGFVALGCVLRGETTHYDIVAGESARGITKLTVDALAAIGNGILTCETEEQAILRADPAQGNKGGEAAHACLRLIALREQFGVTA